MTSQACVVQWQSQLCIKQENGGFELLIVGISQPLTS